MLGLISYLIVFSVITGIVCIPAWIIGKKKSALFLGDYLVLFFCYLLSFILVAFSLSVQSFSSFFWEMVFISLAYILLVYLRVFIPFFVKNKNIITWFFMCAMGGITVLVSLLMPALPD